MFNTVSIACVYTHPVEYLLSNVFPGLSSFFLLKSNAHVVSVLGSFLFLLIATHEGHSGFEFPISPFEAHPFHLTARYHDFHHLKNIGNYAAYFTFWDSLFGTNKVYYELEEELTKKGKLKLE
jgi:sterol desaturase/sphingolipid hydroxylase (fatty acid hydroxylase superfamily)